MGQAAPGASPATTYSVFTAWKGLFSEVDYLTEDQLSLRLPQARLVAHQDQRLLDR